MKIGILTQPLKTNYGGILQNYALQEILRDMGHDPITLRIGKYPLWRWPFSVVKTLVGINKTFAPFPPFELQRSRGMERFIKRYITVSSVRRWYRASDIHHYGLEALIVGSDQTWRPRYNTQVEDLFLEFARSIDILKLSYAASFGTSEWEFTAQQTEICRDLLKCFRAVSVREESGFYLCKEYLDCTATWVLDPTLLLSKEHYENMCKDIPKRKPHIFAYLLDITQEKLIFVKKISDKLGLPVNLISTGSRICMEDCPERWLANFRDAAYVVTDSFHGTVFSLIFQKDFITLRNAKRGNTRFDSLAKVAGIADRIVNIDDVIMCSIPGTVNYAEIVRRLEEARAISLTFLEQNLNRI